MAIAAQYQFKARPINEAVFNGCGTIGVPTTVRSDLTRAWLVPPFPSQHHRNLRSPLTLAPAPLSVSTIPGGTLADSTGAVQPPRGPYPP